MDPIDPLKGMPLQGLSATDAIQFQVKQKLRQSKMEALDSAAPSTDVSDLSADALKLSQPQFEAFLEIAKEELLNMDRNSETFLDDATQKLVFSAFERKFGERFVQDPGYPQMEAKVKRMILNDPECREMIEDFIALIDVDAARQSA